MSRVVTTQTSFTSGEIDPLIEGRQDTQQYGQAAAKMRNVFILPQGGVRRRPGLEWKKTLGTTVALTDVRMIPFRVSDDKNYFVVLQGDGNGEIFNGPDGASIATFTSNPFTGNELQEMTWSQDGDILYLFHKDEPTRILHEPTPGSGTWLIQTRLVEQTPQHTFPDTSTGGVDHVVEIRTIGLNAAPPPFRRFTLILDGEESAVIAHGETDAATAANIQAALRAMDVTNFASVLTVTNGELNQFIVTFTGTTDGNREWTLLGGDATIDNTDGTIITHDTTKGNPNREDAWSSTRGYARCGTFFQGRFHKAGSRVLPQTFWATKSGSVTDWNNRLSADDYGWEIGADTDDINVFHQIHHGRHLQIFADNGEFYLPGSEGDILTPDTVSIRKTGSRGIKEGIPVLGVDGATLYIENSGTALREFLFTDAEAAYESINLSQLSAHLLNTPVRMAYHRSTAANTPDMVLIVNLDGTLAVFSTQRDQNVAGWTLCTTSGGTGGVGFIDVVDADGIMWFVTERTIGSGNKSFYLERFNDDLYVDMGVLDPPLQLDSQVGRFSMLNSVLPAIPGLLFKPAGSDLDTNDRRHMLNLYTGPSSADRTVNGLAHLNGQASKVIIDNTVQPDVTPSSGSATLQRLPLTSWQVGLAWPIVDGGTGIVHIQQLPVVAALPEGASDHKQRRIAEVKVRVYLTSELEIQGKAVAFRTIKSPLDDPIPQFSGFKTVQLEKWGDEGRIDITQTEHLPMTILSITRKVAI